MDTKKLESHAFFLAVQSIVIFVMLTIAAMILAGIAESLAADKAMQDDILASQLRQESKLQELANILYQQNCILDGSDEECHGE